MFREITPQPSATASGAGLLLSVPIQMFRMPHLSAKVGFDLTVDVSLKFTGRFEVGILFSIVIDYLNFKNTILDTGYR